MRGYILAEVEITNPEGYKEYSGMVPGTIEKFGGKFLSRGGTNTPLEGEWLQRRRVIIEFPTVEAARKCYANIAPAFKAAGIKRARQG